MLRGLVVEPGSPTPSPGSNVEGAGKRIGAITSSAFSPVRRAAIALAIIRTSHMAAGTSVEIVVRDGEARIAAVVSDFPLGHPAFGQESGN
jgi:glycine cleavage system aminomethyltransferase T